MSRSIDQLHQAATTVVTKAAGKTLEKDNLIDIIDDQIGFLRSNTQFFVGLGGNNAKLQEWVKKNSTNQTLSSMKIYNQIYAGLTSAGQKAMKERFLGAFVDTLAGLTAILNETVNNIDALYTEKVITIYNTKVSQVAVIGMIHSARVFSTFVTNFIDQMMSDRSASLFKPAAYVTEELRNDLPTVIALINRVIGGQLSKSFVKAIIKYRASGVDTSIVNQDNKVTVQFARINNDVTESDIMAGSKGLIGLSKWIGDLFVDVADIRLRLLRSQREQIQARVQLLQLELDGSDENSAEYKHQVEVIKNYQRLIDRLNQKLAKYEE
jgi:hypothetical protein